MIRYLELDNYRSCQNLRIGLAEPVVALLGKNGVGKTNILHGIQIAAGLCAGRESEYLLDINSHDSKKPIVIGLSFDIDGQEFQYRVTLQRQNIKEILTRDSQKLFSRDGIDVSYLYDDGIEKKYQIGLRAATVPTLLQILSPSDQAVIALSPVLSYLESVQYYALPYRFPEHIHHENSYIETASYNAWKSSYLQDKKPGLSVQMRLLHLSLTDPSRFLELKQLLGDNGLGIVSDIEIMPFQIPNKQIQGVSETTYIIIFVPGKQLAGAEKRFMLTGLSSGTVRVVEILTYLIFDKNSCILLEQPEDSIHTGLLAKLIDILRTYSGQTQLICTTHSPRVINILAPSAVRLITAEDGKTSATELSEHDLASARTYIKNEGTFADFLDTL